MSADSTAAPVVYKVIQGFPRYKVGSDGTVWSSVVNCGGRQRDVAGKTWKKLRPGGTRYLTVQVCAGGKAYSKRVSILVLEAFRGPCPPGHECAHENGNSLDNRLSNLAWKTPKQNNADKKRHGTNPAGEKNPNAKYDEKKIREIKAKLSEGLLGVEVARQCGVSKHVVSLVKLGVRWSHVV